MKEIWVPVSGAIAQQKKVDTIANNIANANTPGFKKDRLVFKEHLAAYENGHNHLDLPNKEWKPADFYRSYGAENGFVKVDNSYTEFSESHLTQTGNPLDLAIRGPGFFEVLTPRGVRYTRKGSFSLNAKAQLTTDQGYLVLSAGDQPAQERAITLQNKPLSINLQGEITQDGAVVSKLSVAEFKNMQLLRKEGNTLFINRFAENISAGNPKSTTYQYQLEASNVNAIDEMQHLIKANRQFESIQNAIRAYNSITGKGVNEIARF